MLFQRGPVVRFGRAQFFELVAGRALIIGIHGVERMVFGSPMQSWREPSRLAHPAYAYARVTSVRLIANDGQFVQERLATVFFIDSDAYLEQDSVIAVSRHLN